ncbi:MAG: hypothetical protein P9X24_19345 [Candidatus Hatepunaea meridiana]|nr:hypothetical protein [Candidatus Hatepunaea meridiana]
MIEFLKDILFIILLAGVIIGAYWIFRRIGKKQVSQSIEIELAHGRASTDILVAVFLYILLFSDRIDGSRVIILGASLNYLLLLLGCVAFYIDFKIRRRTTGADLSAPSQSGGNQ